MYTFNIVLSSIILVGSSILGIVLPYKASNSLWTIISIFILYLLYFFAKKEHYRRDFDISKLLLLMIGIMAFSTYFHQSNISIFGIPLGMSLSVFALYLIFLIDRALEKQNLRLIYMILMSFAFFSKQPICFILLIRLFLDLDFFLKYYKSVINLFFTLFCVIISKDKEV